MHTSPSYTIQVTNDRVYLKNNVYNPHTGSKSTRSETVGSLVEIQKLLGLEDDREEAIAWLKAQARKLTDIEKSANLEAVAQLIDTPLIREVDLGELWLQGVYNTLHIDAMCNKISKESRAKYDLASIFKSLISMRFLHPASKISDVSYSLKLATLDSALDRNAVYRALNVLGERSEDIQEELYKQTSKCMRRKQRVLYYDCTNYYTETEVADNPDDTSQCMRQFGASKEHRPNPIIGQGLLMDQDGIPLAMDIFSGNTNEQVTLRPLEQRIINDMDIDEFIIVTDAGLQSVANKYWNSRLGRHFICTQSIKKLNAQDRARVLDPDGFCDITTGEVFNLDDIRSVYARDDISDEAKSYIYHTIFYKTVPIQEIHEPSETTLNNWLLVTYSQKYAEYMRALREKRVERAEKLVRRGSRAVERRGANDVRNYIKALGDTKVAYEIHEGAIQEEAQYDGFYALCSDLEQDDIPTIIEVAKRRWEIEECFRILKTEFRSRPCYVRKAESLKGHFLICFCALLVLRLLEKATAHTFNHTRLLNVIRNTKGMKEYAGNRRYVYRTTSDITQDYIDLADRLDIPLNKSSLTKGEVGEIKRKSRLRIPKGF